jgi:hypothetical protein
MSSEVRVHVRLGALRLDYEGALAFYESKVEPLIAAAASKGAAQVTLPGGLIDAPTSNGAAALPAAPAASSESPPPPAAVAPRAVEDPQGFVPKTSEFGRYIRRLGPEAGEPDRQVVALAFYLWNYERRETFGRAEIEGCFKALRMPVPEGLNEIFSDLTDRKRFLEAAGDGALRLSKKGENYVKTRLLSS